MFGQGQKEQHPEVQRIDFPVLSHGAKYSWYYSTAEGPAGIADADRRYGMRVIGSDGADGPDTEFLDPVVHYFALKALWSATKCDTRWLPCGCRSYVASGQLSSKSLKSLVGAHGFEPWTR